ncbi:MAG: phosphoglucomutase, alpha-D-glucose phosphate-specific, partial [Gammaproteobacteria bacterium]|nr:phosphoglucomutase, alpha-D-glucose phosphate-specific [Gammaproteobacteria bacterium]
MSLHPLAGQTVPAAMLPNIAQLMAAYYSLTPDVAITSQQVSFGTSGHRGSALLKSFNEQHILAIVQAVAEYRKQQAFSGPLFLGKDTHALSEAAFVSALQVLIANGVETHIQQGGGFTPTPVISHAILSYNKGRTADVADGLIITPSHNPPEDGGIKYNPPHGGPADTDATDWIQKRANALLAAQLDGVKQIGYEE